MSDPREPTIAETACFEAGVKFGTLYHQFAGTPVSPASAESLATAMEEAVENQPHCRAVTVDVRTEALAAAIEEGAAEYTELTGRFLDVEIAVEYEGQTVLTRMEMEEGYPLMRVVSVAEAAADEDASADGDAPADEDASADE
ncbi:dihydroneopterin aldolase family protein [Halobacteria archaeon AArc-dxtr1]|nr:dihydroneopterin aldolase family protein [Halobacteria archaeon AArc-dxtr1]